MTISYLDSKRINGLSTDIAETLTLSDDFSGADNWVDQGASFAVNTTTDVLNFSVTRRDTNDGTTYDLTSTSNSAWVLRTKVNFTTVSNSSASGYYLFIGLSSASSSTDMNNGGLTQDFIGLQAIINNTAPKMGIGAYDSTGSFNNPMTTSFSTLMTVGTIWLEIIRVSTTSLKINIYSDSTYTTLIETISETIPATISSLRYIRVSNGVINGGGSGANTVTGTVDDVKFWNGVSSLHSKPDSTTVQTNSIFTETDTGKITWSGNGWLSGFAIIYGGGGSSTEKFTWATKTSVAGTALANNDQGQSALCQGAVAGYFASGYRAGYISTIYKYNYSDSVITTKSATTSAIHSWGGSWSTPATGYVVRGNNNGGYGTTVEKYSYSGDSISAGTTLTNGSSQTSTHQTKTIGWATSRWAGGSYGDTEKYTFSNDTKTTGTALTTATSGNGVGTSTSTGVIAGGQTGNGVGFQSRIELYNHSNDAVTTASGSLTQTGTSTPSYGNNVYALITTLTNTETVNTLLNDYTYSTGVVTSPTTLGTARRDCTSTTSSNEVIE